MSSTNASLRLGLVAATALAPTLAFAHVGVGATHGFMHGFAHPIGGVDHILAMVAVGIFAANLGGRALWAVPLTFMAFMLAGGTLGILGFPLPFVEVGIALSIVALGVAVAVAVKWEWPVALAMAMVGVFAIFHGHAHGTEMPLDASGAAYALGFVTATGLLHLAGIAIGLGIGKVGQTYSPRIAQAGGTAVAVAGVGILAGII